MKKFYGSSKTHLELSEKALALYNETDPLDIEEVEDNEGARYYNLTGVIERSGLSGDEVNELLEEMYDGTGEEAGRCDRVLEALEALDAEPSFDTFEASPNYHFFPELCGELDVRMEDFSSYGDLFDALVEAARRSGIGVGGIRGCK